MKRRSDRLLRLLIMAWLSALPVLAWPGGRSRPGSIAGQPPIDCALLPRATILPGLILSIVFLLVTTVLAFAHAQARSRSVAPRLLHAAMLVLLVRLAAQLVTGLPVPIALRPDIEMGALLLAGSITGVGALNVFPNAARATGELVIGQPGAGKSKFLELSALQDILAGRGVGVIDPHGDLFHNLTRHLAALLPHMPELAERVIILDPTDHEWTVSLNPLEAVQGVSQERLALFLTDVVAKIWKLDTSSTPRLVWLLTNTFLALADLGLSLLDLRRFLLDPAFREPLLPRLAHDGVRAFFSLEFPQSPAAVQQWATPVLNKLGGLLFDTDIRQILAGRPTFSFREVLDRQLVLLANLSKGTLGEGSSALVGAFIVACLQKAALARADSSEREPFYLYLDEFQNYTTDNIKDILSESRKYGLSLILAHQYLDQLAPDLRSAVLNTIGSLACFRVGYHDASQLAKEIFPAPDYLSWTTREIKLDFLGPVPLPRVETQMKPFGWENLALELANLPPRVFWIRRRGPYVPLRQRTLDVADPQLTDELQGWLSALRTAAGQHYGRPKGEARPSSPSTVSSARPGNGSRPASEHGREGDEEMLREAKRDATE
jgi:hypothetical protein